MQQQMTTASSESPAMGALWALCVKPWLAHLLFDGMAPKMLQQEQSAGGGVVVDSCRSGSWLTVAIPPPRQDVALLFLIPAL